MKPYSRKWSAQGNVIVANLIINPHLTLIFQHANTFFRYTTEKLTILHLYNTLMCIQAFMSFLKCELTCYRSERNLGSGHHCNIELWWCDWWSCGGSCCLADFGGLSRQGDRRSGVGGLIATGQMSSTRGQTWEIFICGNHTEKYIKIINCILIE